MLRHHIRNWLGITDLHHHLQRIEAAMSNITDELNGLKNDFASFAADVDAKLDQLNQAQGDFTPEAQTVFDSIKQAVTDAHGKVGDADGSDTPPADNSGF